MRIITFVTEVGSVQRILEYLGEPTTPPPIAGPRPSEPGGHDPRKGTNPAPNDPLPEYEFDQRVSG